MGNHHSWLKHYDPGVPEKIDYPAVPVFYFLDKAARKYPERPCTVFQDHMISYLEMNVLVDRLASALEDLGVQKGDRVGLLLPNIPQFVLAYYAILKAGGVVVAMNPAYKQRELVYQIRDAGVKVLIALSSTYELLEVVRVQTTSLQRIVLTDLDDAFRLTDLETATREHNEANRTAVFIPGDVWLTDLIASQLPGARVTARVGPEDIAIFQYSGGTTGLPKAAVGTHANLVANSLQFRHWLVGLNEGQEAMLMAIPMYHVYGMVVGMNVSILLGSKMVLIPDPRKLDELLINIQKYQTSFFPGVPTMYAIINQNPEVQAGKYDLRAVRACISGSAPLLKEVKDRFEALTGAQLMEGYGLSEAPTATHCNPMFGEKRTGSIGLPLPDVDCRIVSVEDGETVLPPGEVGELIISGPQVMQGYHNQPEETAAALRSGWLYTGDIARMDLDGYFYILDRKKDLIKVSGFQVWPREIEEVIASHPKVMEAGVVGIPDDIRGEAPKAWVVLKPGQQADSKEIRDWCEEALVYYKVPVEVKFCESLPRTGVGKLLRRELLRKHLEQED